MNLTRPWLSLQVLVGVDSFLVGGGVVNEREREREREREDDMKYTYT
jgi:hypothetical protein